MNNFIKRLEFFWFYAVLIGGWVEKYCEFVKALACGGWFYWFIICSKINSVNVFTSLFIVPCIYRSYMLLLVYA